MGQDVPLNPSGCSLEDIRALIDRFRSMIESVPDEHVLAIYRATCLLRGEEELAAIPDRDNATGYLALALLMT